MHQIQLSADCTLALPPSEALLVLPNGERRLVDIRELETFADLKRKIELEFGLPYELQNIQLSYHPHIISDWIPIGAIYQHNTEVHLRVDQGLTALIRASFRGANQKVARLLEEKGGSVYFEKHLYVGIFVAVGTGNEELWRHLLDLTPNIYKRTASGRNLLHIAVNARNLDCIEHILERTGLALIDSKDKSDESPLDLANKICFFEAVDTFKKYKEASESNRMGRTYLDEKIGHQNEESNLTKNTRLSYLRTNSTDKNRKAVSAPSSPRLRMMQKCQLLDRGKIQNVLKSCASDKDLSTDNSAGLPDISNEESSNLEPAAVLRKSRLSVGANCTSISVSAPVSPVLNTRITEVAEIPSRIRSTLQKKNEDESCRKKSDGNSNQSILEQKPLVMEQVVFLPPWKRGSQKKSENLEQEEKYENQLKVEREAGVEGQKSMRSRARSRSVATINREELRCIAENSQAKKPWNEWRRVSLVTRNERDILIQQMQASDGERKKSFDSWLVEKERLREELTAKTIEEEQMKRVERERLEDERKLRCKSYGRWLAEKEIEAEELREAEKKREIEKQNLEEKLQMRKMEAERKYEKWMREKYDEEIKKEEELHRLMEEKWKIKKEARIRRKSAPAKSSGVEQKSLKTKSLPVL